jgi:hypothetical protein
MKHLLVKHLYGNAKMLADYGKPILLATDARPVK